MERLRRPEGVNRLEFALAVRDRAHNEYPPGDAVRGATQTTLQVVAADGAEAILKYIGDLEVEIGRFRSGGSVPQQTEDV